MLVRSSTWPTLTLHLAVRICGALAPQKDMSTYPEEMSVRREQLINAVFYNTSRSYSLRGGHRDKPKRSATSSPASQGL
jgi:hypothetical protein